ncbi:hypothetical protein BKI52_36895 [marine bacterium AO1-C]|nr:hypothetical protein BKI52_36895 [marine bacterium AO1-C]
MPQKYVSIDKYVGWLQEGKSFTDIRADMKAQGCSEEHINLMVTRINQKAIRIDEKEVKEGSSLNWAFWSGILLITGSSYILVFQQEWNVDALRILYVGIVIWGRGLYKYYKDLRK